MTVKMTTAGLPVSMFSDDDSQSSTVATSTDQCVNGSAMTTSTMQIGRRTRQRKVRFSLDKNVQHACIPNRSDMTEEDNRAIWYNRNDFAEIKQTLIPVIRKMMKEEPLDEEMGETSRGLEYRTREGATRRQRNKRQATHAVLEEQERQLNEGVYEVELLSAVYCRMSAHCKAEAYNLGVRDEATARVITRDIECLRHIHVSPVEDGMDDSLHKDDKVTSGFARFRVARSILNDIRVFTLDHRQAIIGKAA
jgi:hypothetical protein